MPELKANPNWVNLNYQNIIFAMISKAVNGVQDEPFPREKQELVNTAASCVQELYFILEKEAGLPEGKL